MSGILFFIFASCHPLKQETNKQKQLKPKPYPRIQVGKNAKWSIVHSFCFELFFWSITSAIYLKSHHGILEFQLDYKEQKITMFSHIL